MHRSTQAGETNQHASDAREKEGAKGWRLLCEAAVSRFRALSDVASAVLRKVVSYSVLVLRRARIDAVQGESTFAFYFFSASCVRLLSVARIDPHANVCGSALSLQAICVRGMMEEENIYSTFRRNEHPSVRRALPPVGWHSTVEQAPQKTTVDA